jgi:hypothetical protein
MRRVCFSSVAGTDSAPLAGEREQLLIRRRAPQEERQPRREIDVRDAVGRALGFASSGSFSIRKMKYGAGENRLDRAANARPQTHPPHLPTRPCPRPLLVERGSNDRALRS